MNSQRFSYERKVGAPSRPIPKKFTKWIQVSHLNGPILAESIASPRKKFFAIVTAPTSSRLGRPRIQHVVIFDNHPLSLSLLGDVDLTPPRRSVFPYAALAIVLVLTVGLAMFWPLL
jgi:hypothetical protein